MESARTGRHRSADGRFFTTAYFHLPDELESECQDAGFTVHEVVAVEGLGPLLVDLEERLGDEQRREQLLVDLEMLEREPSMLGATSHLLAMAARS